MPQGAGPLDGETSATGEGSQHADAPGSDDDFDAGDDHADEGNDPELTAGRKPDVPSDPDAQ